MPFRLLIIDDDGVDRAAIRRALASAGMEFELVEAPDGARGLAEARASAFECILLDYRLPGQTGLEVLSALRESGFTTPIVMLTGHGDEALAVDIMKAGASDYIPKGSMSPGRLAQSIRQAVRLQRAEDEARLAAQSYAAQLKAVAEAAIALNAVLSAEAVSERVAERARSIMGAEAAVARILSAPDMSGRPRAHPADAAALASAVAALPPVMSASGSALASLPELAALVALGLPAPAQSWLATPLTDRTGARIGLVHVCDARSGTFGENDEAIVVQLAQMASVAIENAWLYEAARASSKARDDMIAIVSHDLRTPLNTIVMGVSLLESPLAAERAADTHQRIRRAAQRMNSLVDDLLDVTKIDAGTLAIEPRPEPLAPIVEESIDQLGPLAAKKKVALHTHVASDMPPVSIDRHRLLQALANLLGNALKFTPAGGSVSVVATHSGDAAHVSVRDTGTGIPPDEVPHLFDRYWQSKPTAGLGAGLGLFITKGIIEAHGGTITVESTLGSGSTFSFVLPLAASEERETA
jgi:signal transduction histidine kinase